MPQERRALSAVARRERKTISLHDDLAIFIQTSFQSVWAVELLCVLRRHPDQAFAPSELVQRLQASDSVVRRSIEGLMIGGLVIVDESGHVRYRPVNSETDRLAGEAEALYAKSAHIVRRLIVGTPGITAFSDAFRLRGDK